MPEQGILPYTIHIFFMGMSGAGMTIKITYNSGDSYIATIPNESYADSIACVLDSIHTNYKREAQE